jgi:hypothetical protein
MAEEKELTVEDPQPTAEAIKQRRKREKAAAKDAALGVEKFTTDVAGVFKRDLKRVMAAHIIKNQQDSHQPRLINLIAADFETQAKMLRCVMTSFVATEKISLLIFEAGMRSLDDNPPEHENVMAIRSDLQ